MNDFSTPGEANIYGIHPSPANFVAPKKRPLSSMSPSIVLDKTGSVSLVISAAGGPWIVTTIARVRSSPAYKDIDQCCIDVGPASPMLAQHQYNIGQCIVSTGSGPSDSHPHKLAYNVLTNIFVLPNYQSDCLYHKPLRILR